MFFLKINAIVLILLVVFSQLSCLKIEVTQTGETTSDRLTRKADLSFTNKATSSIKFTIDPSSTYQKIFGFGAALTEAAAVNFLKLSSDLQNEIFSQYYHNLGYTVARLHINSCDFSESSYSFDDTADDFGLSDWSLNNGHDPHTLIPLAKKALSFNPNLKIFASPWSPPAWMKGNNQMIRSSDPGLKSNPQIHKSWALYFSKWISAYENEGIPIWGVTVQNEPANDPTWEACMYSPSGEAEFIANYLGPQLKNDHPDLKIMIWDYNKDNIEIWADTILGNKQASQYVDGVAFHWYSGSQFENVQSVYEKWGDKYFLFATEACVCPAKGYQDWNRGERYGYDIIGDLNAGSIGWVDWNICLDMEGGPNHLGNNCGSPVMVDADSNPQRVVYNPPFFYMGQISKFLIPDSIRIGLNIQNNDENLVATSFLTPKNQIVLIVQNQNDNERSFDIVYKNMIANYIIPEHAIATFVFDA
ncbi:glucosylceramidase [Anaeramoeba flamelloides]|uniref:Glucosylceramidase n=1 Tax=Anaeramoeba flamelloides TaxID=1746091 RepID=A0AAV7ZZK9_9EUKA|nr:glucosylceramidase [Anaeramoeba flamelloides]